MSRESLAEGSPLQKAFMADINTFIQAVKLPVMPEVAQALIRTLTDDDADVVTVRDIIAKDPALTTTLLRMANSALFGLSRSVTTLDNAVSVVGMAQIRARAIEPALGLTAGIGIRGLHFTADIARQHIDLLRPPGVDLCAAGQWQCRAIGADACAQLA